MRFRDSRLVLFAQVERFESLDAAGQEVRNWMKLRIVLNLRMTIGWRALEFDSVAVARSLLGETALARLD